MPKRRSIPADHQAQILSALRAGAHLETAKAILVGNIMMSFVLENGDKLDEDFRAEAEADIDEEEKAQVLKTLASLTKIRLKDLAIYAGTLYDKIALISHVE